MTFADPTKHSGGFIELGVKDQHGELVGVITRPCTGAKWLCYGKPVSTKPAARCTSRKAAEAYFANLAN